MAYTTIDDPSVYFQTKIYTGNATDDTAYTNDGNSNLQPDFLWVKNREQTVDHVLFDSTRGVTKNVRSNTSSQESTNSNYLKSFDSNGFTMGTSNRVNGNTDEMVAWQWKANGGTTSTNTAGTNIDTTVQANTTAGFSIMTYTGTGTDNDSIGHGLGAVPHWIIVKNRDETNGFQVYHHKNTTAPETDYLNLDDDGATADDHDRWSDQAPSSTVITLGGNDGVSKASTDYVCYAWTEIQGYSKFGSYAGNGNADGPFVYTGFKPAWVMIKRTAGTDHWYIYDIARAESKGNEVDIAIEASNANVEFDTSGDLDFLSNGFKNRGSITVTNANGETYIYMAFAEHPFVSSKGVPVTAR
jgi:hypothetical protein